MLYDQVEEPRGGETPKLTILDKVEGVVAKATKSLNEVMSKNLQSVHEQVQQQVHYIHEDLNKYKTDQHSRAEKMTNAKNLKKLSKA